MADSNEAGVKGLMMKRMEERGLIKSRATTNQAKWERIIRDCVPSEKAFADPKDYHFNILPPRRFWLRWSFIKYAMWDRLHFQFAVAAVVAASFLGHYLHKERIEDLFSEIDFGILAIYFYGLLSFILWSIYVVVIIVCFASIFILPWIILFVMTIAILRRL